MYAIGVFVIIYYILGGGYFSLIYYRKRGRYLPVFGGDNDSDSGSDSDAVNVSGSDIGSDSGSDNVNISDECLLLEPETLVNI